MNVVKELREMAGIQQKELAMAIGVTQPTVSDWENNKKDPKDERLEKLASYFNVSKRVIRGLDPIPGASQPPLMDEEYKELLELREAIRRDPSRRELFDLAKNGLQRDVDQAVAILHVIMREHPDDYFEHK